MVVERGMPGFEVRVSLSNEVSSSTLSVLYVQRGKNLRKMGMKAQDTSELFFDNVRVPASNVLGEVDKVQFFNGIGKPM